MSRFGCAEVTRLEGSCCERCTMGLELIVRGLTGERRAILSAFGTIGHLVAVDAETLEYLRTAGERVGERVAVAHEGML